MLIPRLLSLASSVRLSVYAAQVNSSRWEGSLARELSAIAPGNVLAARAEEPSYWSCSCQQVTGAPPAASTTPTKSTILASSSASVSAPTPTPTLPAAAGPRMVVAHHMVGNTYDSTEADWRADILLAHANGVDGFALNIGRDPWQPARVADAYAAAAKSGTNFKLFLSIDMTSFSCGSANDANILRQYVLSYSSHPNQLRWNSRVLVSTFAGENCNFGQGNVAQGWSSQFTRHPSLTGSNAVFFVPSFFIDPNAFPQYNNIMDGDFNWNGGWSLDASLSMTPSARTQSIGSMESDLAHIRGLNAMPANANGKKLFMSNVSPWFFTHYSPQTYNKNWIYLSDDHLYVTRWEKVIGARNQVDIAQIVTWNDYGESHYIGPIKGAQPNSQSWVNGFDHQGWLAMTSYYATAFKTGAYPAITKDRIFMWARPHPTAATAPDGVGRPTRAELTTDTLWAVIFSTGPGVLTLSSSASNSKVTYINHGVTKVSLPLQVGGYMRGHLARNGQTVVDVKPNGFTFNGSPSAYNFNAFVAASP